VYLCNKKKENVFIVFARKIFILSLDCTISESRRILLYERNVSDMKVDPMVIHDMTTTDFHNLL